MNYLSVEIIRETSSGLPPTAQDLIRPFTAIGLENSPVEVYELERQSRVVKLLRSFYTPVVSNTDKYILGNVDTDLPRPQHFGSQFARRVMPALVDIDFEEGLDKFRGLSGTTTAASASGITPTNRAPLDLESLPSPLRHHITEVAIPAYQEITRAI